MMDPNAMALERLRQIEDRWRMYPGASPGGTGKTGLLSNDAAGWSQILNEQTEYQNLSNRLDNKPPVNIERAGDFSSPPPTDLGYSQLQGPYGTFGAGTGGMEPYAVDGLKKAAPKSKLTIKAVR